MKDYKKLLDETMVNLGKFSKQTPDEMKGFHGFMEAAEAEGALDKKQKELIAVSCAVVAHCERCIAFHVNGAIKAGASRKEILEAAWVAVLMGGGPALMYAQGVLKALDDFKAK